MADLRAYCKLCHTITDHLYIRESRKRICSVCGAEARVRRGMMKKRGKLSELHKAEILRRLEADEKQSDLAREYQVNPSIICILKKKHGVKKAPAEEKHTCQASPASMQVAKALGAIERQDIADAIREVATALRSMVEEMKTARRTNAR